MATAIPVFEMVDPKDAAPKSVKSISNDVLALREFYDGFVKGLQRGKVAKITVPDAEPGEEKNPRSIQMLIHRAAIRQGIEVECWNDGNFVYCQLKAPAKNGAKAEATV